MISYGLSYPCYSHGSFRCIRHLTFLPFHDVVQTVPERLRNAPQNVKSFIEGRKDHIDESGPGDFIWRPALNQPKVIESETEIPEIDTQINTMAWQMIYMIFQLVPGESDTSIDPPGRDTPIITWRRSRSSR